MASYDDGKEYVVAWIKEHFPKGSTCLDVGACDGKWSRLIGDWLVMDAVEVWRPYIEENDLKSQYRFVYECDIRQLNYEYYDLIIFGDVLEHLSSDDAKQELDYAVTRCKDLVIGVPFLYHQDMINGNPYEKHIQDDLTPELFNKRFPGFKAICFPRRDYAYYSKESPL